MRILKNKNQYQKTHRPVRKEVVKCDGEILDGYCQKCGALMQNKQNGKCRHNAYMQSLGVIYYYSNGSAYQENPGKEYIECAENQIKYLKKIGRIL